MPKTSRFQLHADGLRAVAGETVAPPEVVASDSSRRPVRREFRWAHFGVSLVIFAAFAAGFHVVHEWQVQRLASMFLDRANQLEKEKRWTEAAGYLEKYLQLQSNDNEERIHLAEVFEKNATTPDAKRRAVGLFVRAANAAAILSENGEPERVARRDGLRVRLAELLLDIERYKPAEELAKELITTEQVAPRALRVLAVSQFERLGTRESQPEEVIENLTKAWAASPDDIDLASRLARAHREHGSEDTEQARAANADGVMDELVRRNPELAAAFLARYAYHRRYEKPAAARNRSESDPDLIQAIALAPEDPKVLVVAANDAVRRGNLEEAEQHLFRLIAADPRTAVGYDALARLHEKRGRTQEAAEVLREGLDRVGPSDLFLALRYAEVLISNDDLPGADRTLTELYKQFNQQSPFLAPRARSFWKDGTDLARATWYLKSDLPAKALEKLSTVASWGNTDQRAQGFVIQSAALFAMGQPDKAADAMERAAALRTDLDESRMAAGDALLSLRRFDQAIAVYRQVLTTNNSAEIWYRLARAYLLREAGNPNPKKDWTSFQEALQKARTSPGSDLADKWRLAILEAQHALFQGDKNLPAQRGVDQAYQVLKQAEMDFPQSTALHKQLIHAYQQLGKSDDADRALEKWLATKPNIIDVVLTRATLLDLRGQSKEAVKSLQDAIAKAGEGHEGREEIPLHYALAERLVRIGQLNAARTEWERILVLSPLEVRATRLYLETLLVDPTRGPDWEDKCRSFEQKLEEIEGKDGANVRFYRATRLTQSAKGPADLKLQQAEELQKQLESERPDWPLAYSLKGNLREVQARPSDAIKAYDDAIRLGEQRLVIFERQMALLYREQRLDEVEKLLAKLSNSALGSTSLSGYALQSALRNEDTEGALALARRGVVVRPGDPMAWIWLGSLLENLLRKDPMAIAEAEQAYQRAVQVAPGDLRTWRNLITYFGRARQAERLREALEAFDETAKRQPIPAVERCLTAAAGYVLLEDWNLAENRYLEALKVAPNDARVNVAWAYFCLRHRRDQAEAAARQAVLVAPKSIEARHLLAVQLASGDATAWNEVQQLLSSQKKGTAESIRDQRLLVSMALARLDWDVAEKALLSLVGNQTQAKSASDLRLLGNVLEARGNWEAAEHRLEELANLEPPSAENLIPLLEFRLRRKRLEGVERWLDALEMHEPASLRSLGYRARWLKARGNDSDVLATVDGHFETKLNENLPDDQRAQLLKQAGDLYTALGMNAAAESWYRKLNVLDSGQFAPLAVAVARQGKVDEGIDLCLQAADGGDTAEAAMTLLMLLTDARASDEQWMRGQPLIEKAEREHPQNVGLNLAIAHAALVRENVNPAAVHYKRVLEVEANHLVALNNLAALLGERAETRAEALAYVERAIEAAGGANATLFDTKGTILLNDGKTKEAAELLERSVSDVNADPKNWLHLAAAQLRLGELEKARDSFRHFRGAIQDQRSLSSLEKKMFAELNASVGNDATNTAEKK